MSYHERSPKSKFHFVSKERLFSFEEPKGDPVQTALVMQPRAMGKLE